MTIDPDAVGVGWLVGCLLFGLVGGALGVVAIRRGGRASRSSS